VALLLRSAEIQPPSHDLFDWFLPRNPIPPLHLLRDSYRVTWPAVLRRSSPAVRPNERPVCLPMDRQHGTRVPGQLPPRASRALRSLHWPGSLQPCRPLCRLAVPVQLHCSLWLQVRYVTAPRPCNGRRPVPACEPFAHRLSDRWCTTVTTMLACPVNSCRHQDGRQLVCFPRLVKPCEERQAAFIDGSAVCLFFHQSVVGVLQCSGS